MVYVFHIRTTIATFTLVIAILTLSASADDLRPPQCYEKYHNCCYKYVQCGYVDKTVKLETRCDYKKCDKVCKPHCKVVKKTVPTEACGHHGCKVKYVDIEDKVCEAVCKNECKWIKAICIKYNVFQYIKYCPKLECKDWKIEGKSNAPEEYVGKDSKILKTIAGDRKIIEHAH